MVITFVLDMIGDKTNGTTVTALRSADCLIQLGHEVRFIAAVVGNIVPLEKKYKIFPVEHRINLYCFNSLVKKNGMVLAKLNKEDYPLVKEFLKGSDLVHILMPFRLGCQVRTIAKIMNIPITSAMHVQPENISYNINLGHLSFVNSYIYHFFKTIMYKKVEYIHTPSEMMRDEMKRHHYKNKIYPISNGVSPFFDRMKVEKPEELKDKFVVLMVGRLSGEKRQDLLIKAIKHSAHEKDIQLILLGKGPKIKKINKLSKGLTNPLINKVVDQEELKKIINYCDLYVHASDAESEAIACIEAFSCGKVPVISYSKVSATNHFALDSRCLFKAGDYMSLKEKIDYFFENRDELAPLSEKYYEYGKSFSLEICVKKLEEMFYDAIDTFNEDKKEKKTYFLTKKEKIRLKRAAKYAQVDEIEVLSYEKK